MAIPKTKSKHLSDQSQKIKQAIETASKGSETEKPQKVTRLGRRPLAGDRSGKMTFFMSPETKERFDIAFLQEQLKRRKNGEKIDKSLLVEEALKAFLDKNSY